MLNLTKKTKNLIFFISLILYRTYITLGILLIIYLFLPDSVINTLSLFNYLPNFLTILHKTPETVSSITDIQEIKENLSLLSNLNIIQDATILELINQLKEANQTILNLKDTVNTLNTEHKQSIETLTSIINELPTKITPIIPEIVLPEINTKAIETIVNVNLEKQNNTMNNILNKLENITSLQQIQLEQVKLSYKTLKSQLIIQDTNLIEIKNTIISKNQLVLDALSSKTKELLVNLNTSSTSITNNNSLLNQLITNQKEILTTLDFTNGLDTVKENFININSNLIENEKAVKDISSTLTGLDYNFHNKINNLETKVDAVQSTVDNINSAKVVKTEVQGNSQSMWNWNKK